MGAGKQRSRTSPAAVPQYLRRAKSPRHTAVPASTAPCGRWGGAASPGRAAQGSAPLQTVWFWEQSDLLAEERNRRQAGRLPAVSSVPRSHPGWRWVRGGPGEAHQRWVGVMPPEGTTPPPTPTPALGAERAPWAATRGAALQGRKSYFLLTDASWRLHCWRSAQARVCRGTEMWFQYCF